MVKQDIDHLIATKGLPQAAAQCRLAGVLFTYRCSISCRHCLFSCTPKQPNRVMSPRQCADNLLALHETGRVVHITGGEPMLYWDTLSEGIRLAHQEGNAPHFLETNCSFAVSDKLVYQRFVFLATFGVKGIYASSDPFHQEFVPAERFLRVRRLAKQVFGEKSFWGPEIGDAEILDFQAITRNEIRLRDYVRKRPLNIVGTAHKELARYLDNYAPHDSKLPAWGWDKAKTGAGCLAAFQANTIWEFYIDPYNNIQTNCGMILGKATEISPSRLLALGTEKANRFVQTICDKGPLGLAELAQREYGFAPPEHVTQTCELCYLTRRFLREFHPDVFGPMDIYVG